jgi:hypothetical protein
MNRLSLIELCRMLVGIKNGQQILMFSDDSTEKLRLGISKINARAKQSRIFYAGLIFISPST